MGAPDCPRKLSVACAWWDVGALGPSCVLETVLGAKVAFKLCWIVPECFHPPLSLLFVSRWNSQCQESQDRAQGCVPPSPAWLVVTGSLLPFHTVSGLSWAL